MSDLHNEMGEGHADGAFWCNKCRAPHNKGVEYPCEPPSLGEPEPDSFYICREGCELVSPQEISGSCLLHQAEWEYVDRAAQLSPGEPSVVAIVRVADRLDLEAGAIRRMKPNELDQTTATIMERQATELRAAVAASPGEPSKEMVEAANQYIDALHALIVGYRHRVAHKRIDMLWDVAYIARDRWHVAAAAALAVAQPDHLGTKVVTCPRASTGPFEDAAQPSNPPEIRGRNEAPLPDTQPDTRINNEGLSVCYCHNMQWDECPDYVAPLPDTEEPK